MTIDTDELSASLGRLAEREPVPDAPVGPVLRRAHRARRTNAALAAGAVIAVLALAGGVALRPVLDPRPDSQPDLSLAAAVRATAAGSYRFTTTLAIDGRGTTTAEGAYDPAGPTGYLRGSAGSLYLDERVVDGDWYVGTRPEGRDMFWARAKPGFTGFAVRQGTEVTSDPVALLESFTALGTVTREGRRGSGGDAVEVYAFTFRRAEDIAATAGTIEVGVAAGKVRRITWRTRAQASPADTFWYTSTLVFSGYGTKVEVDRPM